MKGSFNSRHCLLCLATIFSSPSAIISIFLRVNLYPPLPAANATTVFRHLILSSFGASLNSSEYNSPARISFFRFITFASFSLSGFDALYKFQSCHPFPQTGLYQLSTRFSPNMIRTAYAPLQVKALTIGIEFNLVHLVANVHGQHTQHLWALVFAI